MNSSFQFAKINPSKIGKYIELQHCDRYLYFCAKDTSKKVIVDHLLDRTFSQNLGKKTEDQVENLLKQRKYMPGSDEFEIEIKDVLKIVECGGHERYFFREVIVLSPLKIFNTMFEIDGRIDFLLFDKSEENIKITVLECKSSHEERNSFILQLALYAEALRINLKADITTRLVTRNMENGCVLDNFLDVPAISADTIFSALHDAMAIVARQFNIKKETFPSAYFNARCERCHYYSECFRRSKKNGISWDILGLKLAEQMALRSEGQEKAISIDAKKVKSALRKGLLHSKSQLENLHQLRNDYYVLRTTNNPELLPRGIGRLPRKNKNNFLIQVFIYTIPFFTAAAPMRVTAMIRTIGSATQLEPIELDWDNATSFAKKIAQELDVICQRLNLNTQSFSIHCYFWRRADFVCLLEELLKFTNAPEALALAQFLTESNAAADEHSPRHPRFTILQKYINHRCETGCLGTTLLELSQLRGSGVNASRWLELEKWLSILVDPEGPRLPPKDSNEVRSMLLDRPIFSDDLPLEIRDEMERNVDLKRNIARIYLLSMGELEETLRGLHDHDKQLPPAIELHDINPLKKTVEEHLAHPLVAASILFLEGARDSAKRKWFAGILRNSDELVATRQALKLYDPVWQPREDKKDQYMVAAYTDIDLFIQKNATGLTDKALKDLKLECNTRIVPLNGGRSAVVPSSVISDGIEITKGFIKDKRDPKNPDRIQILLNSRGKSRNADVGSRSYVPRVAGEKLTSHLGTEITSMLLTKDFCFEIMSGKEALKQLMNDPIGDKGALDWWQNIVPAIPEDLTVEDSSLLVDTLNWYASLRESCETEYEQYRFHLESKSDADQLNLALSTLRQALDDKNHKLQAEGIDIGTTLSHALDDINLTLSGFISKRLGVLQGPPGTGKTEFAAVAIILWALWRSLKLGVNAEFPAAFVTGVSHVSVDNILRRCAMIAPVMMEAWKRACSATNTTPIQIERWITQNNAPLFSSMEVEPATNQSQLTMINAYVDSPKDGKSTINKIRVVGAVIAQLPNILNSKKSRGEFQLLVFDEASQIKLHDGLLALPNLNAKSGQIFVVGDHRQLGPIASKEAGGDLRPLVHQYKPYQSMYDFAKDLRTPKFLDYTFRLQEDSWKLIREIYAQDKIKLNGRVIDKTKPLIKPACALKLLSDDWEGVCLLKYKTGEWDSCHSFNMAEVAIIELLLTGASDEVIANCAVLSPFNKQNEDIADCVTKFNTQKIHISVGTVDGMQGSEKETIIYSAVCGAGLLSRLEEFVLDIKRANVAFSRSQKRLIVIASNDLLDHAPASPELTDAMLLWKRLRDRATDQLPGSPFTVTFKDEKIKAHELIVNALMVVSPTEHA
ncbi:MAG: AAA domain-containing protein [Gallionella sp.]|nr:AAA domain-containing protein [Gallionella sp.]